MYKLGRIIKKIFSFLFTLLILGGLAFAVYFYFGWFEKQYDKVQGLYYVYQGDKQLKKHKLQEAIDLYNKGLSLYPEHYGAWFNLGNIYVVYEDYYAAVDAYEQAIKHNPKFTVAKMNRGVILSEKLGDFDGAIAQYESIMNTRKKLIHIPFVFNNKKSEKINKGLAYYNMGVAFRKKSIYLPDEERNKAHIYLTSAINSYKKGLKILKKHYDSRYNLAIAYHMLGDYSQAGLNYCKAIDIEPMKYEAHYNLAVLLRHLKMYNESKEELEKAAVLISGDDGSSNQARYIFDVLNDVSRTIAMYNEFHYMVEKLDESDATSNDLNALKEVTSVNGRIVASDELDLAMLNNFKTCRSYTYFKSHEN